MKTTIPAATNAITAVTPRTEPTIAPVLIPSETQGYKHYHFLKGNFGSFPPGPFSVFFVILPYHVCTDFR